MITSALDIRPKVGVSLTGNGCVVEHGKVIDSLSRWHGLIRLVIDHIAVYPNPDPWQEMLLPGANVCAIIKSKDKVFRLIILYKLDGVQ